MLALETCPRVEPVLRPTAPTPPATVPTADAKGSPAAKASSPVLSSVHNSVSHGHGASCCSCAAMCRPQVSASGAPFAAPCPPEVPASPAGSAASRDNPAFLAACTFGLPLKTRAEIKADIATHAACASFRHRLQTNHSDLTKWSFRVLCAEDVEFPYVVLATYFCNRVGMLQERSCCPACDSMNTTRRRILAKFLPLLRKLLLQHSLPKVQHQHVTCCCTSKLNVLAHHCQMLPRFPIGSDVRSRKQSCRMKLRPITQEMSSVLWL